MVTMTKTITFVILTCYGCATCFCIGCARARGPGPRRLSRGRSHLQTQYRRIPLTTTTSMMIILMSSHWQILNLRVMEGAVLLVIVPGGRPILLRLCSDPARCDGAAAASTLLLTALTEVGGKILEQRATQ